MGFRVKLIIYLGLFHAFSLGWSQEVPVDFPYFNQMSQFDTTSNQSRIAVPILSIKSFKVKVLAPSMRFLYESEYPFKQNTGEMLPAIGSQFLFQAGVFAEWKWLEFQVRPAFLSAANRRYDWFPDSHNANRWKNYSIWINFSDAPPHLHSRNHNRVYLGQSYFKLKKFNQSFSISNESMFWGPGKRNALLLSNHGAPFIHFKFENDQPVGTKVGTFNYQLFGGWLKNSISEELDSTKSFFKSTLFFDRNRDNRYINGMKVNWSPSLIPSLRFEFQSVTQLYERQARTRFNYLPSLAFILSNRESQLNSRWSHYQSVSFDWKFDKHMQLYGAWARKGARKTFSMIIEDPSLQTSFLYGFNKTTKITKKLRIYSEIEGIFLARRNLHEIRNPNSWYTDYHISQGHTHRGQWLGSGIGPGSNRVTVDISLLTNDNNKIGLLLDRRLHNSDYYYFQFEHVRDFRRYWVDHGLFLHGNLKFGNWVADFQTGKIFGINYQWELDETADVYFTEGRDLDSFQCFINTAFLF